MQLSQIPVKIYTPWATSAGASYIRTVPVPSQIGISNGAASWTDGFPPLCFVPAGSGGYPPDGRDLNYVLALLSQWARWFAAGGTPQYDATFQTNIGGYPKGAMLVAAAGQSLWISTADNNTTDPDTGGAGWVAPGSFPSGTRLAFQQTAAPAGWTKDMTVTNDAIMRLVTGTVSSGGSTAFSTWNSQSATGAHTLSVAEMPNHTHTVSDPGHHHTYYGGTANISVAGGSASSSLNPSNQNTSTATTGITNVATGGGGSHTHPLTQSVLYFDFIVAQKN